jgi:hypothetical protein
MTSVATVSGWTHPTNGAALSTWKAIGIEDVRTAVPRLLGEHHEPLVVFFGVVFLVASRLVPSHVHMLNSAKVGATICLDNDKIANSDLKACALLDEEDI